MKEKIVIWGTKFQAEKILYQCMKDNMECQYIIDNDVTGLFHNIPIYNIEEAPALIQYYCIVSCGSFVNTHPWVPQNKRNRHFQAISIDLNLDI